MRAYVLLLATASSLTPSRAPPKVQKPPIGTPLDAAALAEENVRGRRYWHDPRIHNFGNVGFSGLFASFCAPVATAIIDLAAYQGRDVRKECAEAAAAAVNGPVGVAWQYVLDGRRNAPRRASRWQCFLDARRECTSSARVKKRHYAFDARRGVALRPRRASRMYLPR